MVFGLLFLGEPISFEMVIGCALILAGTGLATGVIARLFRGGW